MDKVKVLQLALILLLLTVMVCPAFAAEDVLSLLDGKTAGVVTGTTQEANVRESLPNAKIQYFNNVTDVALALENGKIDFAALASVSYYMLAQEYPDLGYLNMPLAYYDLGAIFPKTQKGDTIRAELNEYIASLKESGKLDQMQQYWLYPNDWDTFDIPQTGEKGILTLATASTMKPFSFKLNGKNVGYDIEIIAGFCREYGYGLKIVDVDFAGMLTGITTGRYDFATAQISWTEERAKSVNYSDFWYTQDVVPIVNAKNFDSPYLVTAGQDAPSGYEFKTSVGRSVYRTLIEEDRWISVLQGLLVTLIITVAGFALANLLGAAFCAMAMSKSRVPRAIADFYSRLMQGLPVVVILMILYYIVFGKSHISNVAVAIMGFALVFGATMAQLFEGGIRSVDAGQTEAALATGLTKYQAFCGIVLPQAIRTMLPGYFSNLISLMKGTAVVGYIAVNDLTKVGDIIRSNTYEAIVPLLIIALVYFTIACLLLSLMKLLKKKLLPKCGGRTDNEGNLPGGAKA